MTRFIAFLYCLFVVTSAQAQDNEEVTSLSPFVINLDPVMVSRFQAEDGFEQDAERVRQLLMKRVEEYFISVTLEDVPPFEHYDAVIYLRSCPKTELVGCAYVIGARGGAEWVITGQVKRKRDEGELVLDDEGDELTDEAPLAVEIHIIDIKESRVALAFDAALTRETEAIFADTVVDIVNKLVEGEGKLNDLRESMDDPQMSAERKKLESAILAGSLGDLERELGGLVARESGTFDVPKLTEADLEEYDQRDDVPPWELVNLEKKEYLRFKNSGKNILEWRSLKKGRQGRILLGGSVQFGAAMYEQWFDGRWALDNSDLTPIEVDEWQEVRVGSTVGMDFSLGYGILPEFDISLDLGFRAAGYHYLFHKEVEGSPQEAKEPSRVPISTFRFGGSVTYSPLPTWTIRPTMTGAFSVWMGQPVNHVVDITMAGPIEPLPAPTLFFVHASPGGEITVNDNLVLFARFRMSFLVGGNRVEALELLGDGFLSTTSEPMGKWAPGFEGEAGLQFRIGPLTRKKKTRLLDD